jgi:zinc transport system substrate-binding protein
MNLINSSSRSETTGRFVLTFALALLAALSNGCKRELATASERPNIVASFFPLHDFARALAGTNFNVICLTPPGGDPHGMEAGPQLAGMVADAQLVLLLGLGMDGWVEKLSVSERKVRVSVTSLGIAPKRVGKAALGEFAEGGHGRHSGHAHEHDTNEMDPHVWLDPVLAQQIVRRIADEMIAVAPQHRAEVEARREDYLRELRKLHDEFTAGLAEVKRRQVVTFHGAFAYLFARYKLETVGVIELFPGDEPSAAYLRRLVDLMRQLQMKVIFAEPQLSDRPAQVIAREIGGRVERLDPCETILPDAPQATYLERQRRNLETLRRVLNEL